MADPENGEQLQTERSEVKMLFKETIYGVVASLVYRWRTTIAVSESPKVMSIEQTVETVLTTDSSLVRFGDGELAILQGGFISYQNYSRQLADELRDALTTERPKFLVCVPGVFDGMPDVDKSIRSWWIKQLLRGYLPWKALTGSKRLFGNAFLSRPYMMHRHFPRSKIDSLFRDIQRLWHARDVTIVEGTDTRFGVGNDLLDNAASVTRILCPSRNAFEALRQIEESCLAVPTGNLFLVALGPAAKPLIVRLHRSGRRALDLGHLDIEYEWFLRDAKGPVLVPGKAMDGTVGTEGTGASGEDAMYLRQVIDTISA